MPFRCEKCGMFFMRRTQLNNHINRKKSCTAQIVPRCDICNKLFRTYSSLNRHMVKCTPTESNLPDKFIELKKIVTEQGNIIKKLKKRYSRSI